MRSALPRLVGAEELPPLSWHEQQRATQCPTCVDWDSEAGDPEWIRQLEAEANSEPVQWAIPGVTGLSSPGPDQLPSVSAAVAALQVAVARVIALDPTGQAAAQALVDAEALLAVEQQLRVHSIRTIGDAHRRGLFDLVGFRSVRSWLRNRRPDGDSSDAMLAISLTDFPQLHTSVDTGAVPLLSARKVVTALRRCAPHLDHPDGLIDAQPAAEVLPAVVTNTIGLICRYLSGLSDTDPRLAVLIDRGKRILSSGTQRDQVEAAFTMLAEHIPLRSLTAHLEELVLSLLPSELEDAAAQGHANRKLMITRKPDGTGWHLNGDLNLECGERLFTILRAEAGRDPDNPADTAAWKALCESNASTDALLTDQPLAPRPMPDSTGLAWFDLPDELRPRRKGERLHDALNRMLARYLEDGHAGTSHKVPVQISVAVNEPTVTGQPGHLPARADSGALIPRSLLTRWWCDSTVTAYVLSLGGKALRAVHGQRTLSAIERKALSIETGSRCAGLHCCPDRPEPTQRLSPHHVRMFSKHKSTGLDDTLWVCDRLHHDLHTGKRSLLLRDGRYLNEHGLHDQMPDPEPPPF